MSSSTGSRRGGFQPPPRPEWVQRINEEGSYMDIRGVVPLDADSLIAAAKRSTGLDNFGSDEWREPFEVYVKSLDEEAQLNLMGRLMTRWDVLLFLMARLQVEQAYKEHPEIEDEEIVKPLLIMGQGRSGTSALQNLLSADPNNGTTRTWEVMFPYPPPEKATYHNDPRIEKAHRAITMWNRVTPTLEAMHEFNGEIPTESVHVQCLSFATPGWLNLMGQVPSYNTYMATKSFVPTYEYEKRVLKLLQWKNPRKHWVLKTPDYILRMPDVLKVYPDAGFIWTHRDPIKAIASSVNIMGTINWMRSDVPFIQAMAAGAAEKGYDQWSNSDLAAMMLNMAIDWLEDGTVSKDRVCNVQYSDFVSDPIGVVQKIYDQFGVPMTTEGRAAMQRYLEEAPRSRRPAHDYEVGADDIINQERSAFKRYQEYFNVPNEVATPRA